MNRPERLQPGVKLRDADKVSRIPIKIVPSERETMLRKPDWLRVKLPASNQRILDIKSALRKNGLHSVCEEASCPNLAECFNHGTATFMILGAICTRRCPFCDVAHGRPLQPDAEEPKKLAQTIADMKLKYVVITSVDRDDLRDGGAQHFADCIREIRILNPEIKILLTVSPVPLTATATGHHVLLATQYSKSVLRAVAGDLSEMAKDIDYFPSYEIIAAPPTRAQFFAPNMRSVAPEGVALVMEHFFRGMRFSKSQLPKDEAEARRRAGVAAEAAAEELACEEILLDQGAKA